MVFIKQGNPILFKSRIKSRKIMPFTLHFCKNGLTGSATQLIFIIKYRYCISGLVVKDLLLDNYG